MIDTANPNAGKEPTPEAAPTGVDAGGAQPNDGLVTLQFTAEFLEQMFQEIQDAQSRRDEYAKEWDILLKEYLPNVAASGTAEDLKTNLHFRNIHTKLAQIFYDLPDLYLEPRRPMKDPIQIAMDPMTGQPVPITAEDSITVKKEVLNFHLGEDKIDAVWLMDQLLMDALGYSGIFAAKAGYRAYTKQVQKPVMIPDPNFIPPMPIPQPGSTLGLGGPGMAPPPEPPMIQATEFNPDTLQQEPKFEMVTVVVHEDWYANRISPKKLLLPKSLLSGRVDKDACWVGHEFFFTKTQLKKTFNIDPEQLQLNATGSDTQTADLPKETAGNKKNDMYHGYELFLRASEYSDEVHPQVVYQLVLLEGMKEKPLVYRLSPDQTIDEEGRLTLDSLIGFPIEVGSLRDVPDTPYAGSDAAFVNNTVKQLNTFRKQGVQMRDVNVGRHLVDGDAFTKEEIERIKNGKPGETYITEPGKLAAGVDKIVVQWPQQRISQDDYRTAAALKQDMDEAIGVSAAEAGVTDDASPKTATEVAGAGSKANARLSKDRQRASKFYIRLARKIDALLMRWATEEDYIMIEGKVGAQRLLVAWSNKNISLPCAYRMKPDSQLHLDVAKSRQQLLAYLKEAALDPMINRFPIHRELARQFNLDPSEIVLNPATAQMMAASGMTPSTSAPPKPGSSPDERAGNAPDDRPHVATGGRPNGPQPGSPTPPSVQR